MNSASLNKSPVQFHPSSQGDYTSVGKMEILTSWYDHKAEDLSLRAEKWERERERAQTFIKAAHATKEIGSSSILPEISPEGY